MPRHLTARTACALDLLLMARASRGFTATLPELVELALQIASLRVVFARGSHASN